MSDTITLSSSEARERWSEVKRKAQTSIIEVESNGRPDVYIMSPVEYQRYQELKLESLKAEVNFGIEQAKKGEYSDATAKDIISRVKSR